MLDGRATRWSVRWHGTPSWQLKGCNTPTGAQVGARGSSIRCESRKGGASGRAGCEHEFPSTGFIDQYWMAHIRTRSAARDAPLSQAAFGCFPHRFAESFCVYVFREGGSTDPEINGRRPGRLRQHVHLIHDELESGAERVEAPPGYILPRYRKSVAFMTDVSHTGPHTTSIARWPALGLGTPPIPRSTDRMQLKIVRRVFPFGA